MPVVNTAVLDTLKFGKRVDFMLIVLMTKNNKAGGNLEVMGKFMA